MLTSDFDFEFPQDLIAYTPAPRGESRMMVLDKSGDSPAEFVTTGQLGQYLRKGDALVLNDTKVLKARLLGSSPSGAAVEALLLAPASSSDLGQVGVDATSDASQISLGARWQALVKPGKRFRPGDIVDFPPALRAKVVSVLENGVRILEFDASHKDFSARLEVTGKVPLPPYIKRAAEANDELRYQSVFAAEPGSVAAPTASLHLSEAMLEAISAQGVEIVKVTLHVGAGTFKPVQSENLSGHKMHSEVFVLSESSAAKLNAVRAAGGRIFAVGTTAARVLETQAQGPTDKPFQAGAGTTEIFIYPGYAWKGVDGLLTNFHWPKSTLFMLVASFLTDGDPGPCGLTRAKAAYADAFAKRFRLFSYGDAMLIR